MSYIRCSYSSIQKPRCGEEHCVQCYGKENCTVSQVTNAVWNIALITVWKKCCQDGMMRAGAFVLSIYYSQAAVLWVYGNSRTKAD